MSVSCPHGHLHKRFKSLGRPHTVLNWYVGKGEAKMADLKTALNEKGEEENILSAAPADVNKATGGAIEPEDDAKPTGEAETEGAEAETGEGSKKGYTQRVRELNTKAKEAEVRAQEAEATAQSMAERLAELTGSVEPPAYGPTYPQVEPGSEVTQEQYGQDVMRVADSLVTLRMKQRDILDKINVEANAAVRAFPQLDPESDTFDKELSESVTEAVEAHVKADPYNASVKNIVNKLMKPYQRAVAKEVGKVTENIAKQVSETALRPPQIVTGEKKFEELSIKEMEKQLGVIQ